LSAKHPEKKSCVALDYGLGSVMMPTVLMGSFIGVWFNIVLPEIAIQIILALLLFFLTFQAGTKVVEIYKKENKAIKDKLKKQTMGSDKSTSKKSKKRSSSTLGLAQGKKQSEKMRGESFKMVEDNKNLQQVVSQLNGTSFLSSQNAGMS
jgi:hypothetical protein